MDRRDDYRHIFGCIFRIGRNLDRFVAPMAPKVNYGADIPVDPDERLSAGYSNISSARGKFEEHSSVNLDSREFVLTITEQKVPGRRPYSRITTKTTW
jgi:hypothetical protein